MLQSQETEEEGAKSYEMERELRLMWGGSLGADGSIEVLQFISALPHLRYQRNVAPECRRTAWTRTRKQPRDAQVSQHLRKSAEVSE